MDGSWDAYLASPADFLEGADDITKEREPGIEIIERTPLSLIITSLCSKKTQHWQRGQVTHKRPFCSKENGAIKLISNFDNY